MKKLMLEVGPEVWMDNRNGRGVQVMERVGAHALHRVEKPR